MLVEIEFLYCWRDIVTCISGLFLQSTDRTSFKSLFLSWSCIVDLFIFIWSSFVHNCCSTQSGFMSELIGNCCSLKGIWWCKLFEVFELFLHFGNLVSGLRMASDEPNSCFKSWKTWQKHSLNLEAYDLFGNSPFAAVHVMIPKVAGMMGSLSLEVILQRYELGNGKISS